jgi:pilus assembly protein CpaE
MPMNRCSMRYASPALASWWTLPHHWTPWIKATLIAADEIVVVASPDLASLRNTKNILDLLRVNRPNDTPPRVVLNKVGVAKRPEIPAKDFAETIGHEPALVLPYDPRIFGQAANNGQMLAELGQTSPVIDGIRSLAGKLTGRKPRSAAEVVPVAVCGEEEGLNGVWTPRLG